MALRDRPASDPPDRAARARCRGARDRRSARRAPPGHADRPRRGGQDPAGHPGAAELARVPGRRLVRGPRPGARSHLVADRRPDPRRGGDAGADRSRRSSPRSGSAGRPAGPGQPRAPARRGAAYRRPPLGLPRLAVLATSRRRCVSPASTSSPSRPSRAGGRPPPADPLDPGGPALRRARARRRTPTSPYRRERRAGARDLRTARRPAAGHRAGRRAGELLSPAALLARWSVAWRC